MGRRGRNGLWLYAAVAGTVGMLMVGREMLRLVDVLRTGMPPVPEFTFRGLIAGFFILTAIGAALLALWLGYREQQRDGDAG